MFITVSAVAGGGWLTIRVENDGRSIDLQTLARLRTVFDSKTSDTAAGIGLNNFVYRLSLRYGRHYQARGGVRRRLHGVHHPDSGAGEEQAGRG